MDVSDIRYLQIIYVIMDETESERESLSHYEFRFLILGNLEKCGFTVRIYDEGVFLYTVDHKILIYFPEFDKSYTESKQYERTVPYLEGRRLDGWVHNKAIQKSVESYRITDEQKAYLKTLKVRLSK